MSLDAAELRQPRAVVDYLTHLRTRIAARPERPYFTWSDR